MAPVAAAHRLVLPAVELASLLRRTGLRLPPPFDVHPAEAGTGAADEGPVHPSVAANLAVLAGPDVLVHTEASLPGGRSRSLHAVAGELGASLFALADGAVELSLFPAVDLGRELIRAVPPPDPEGAGARIRAALGDAAPEPPAGRLPWAALADFEAARTLSGRDGVRAVLGLTHEQATLAADLADRTEGGLTARVLGPDGHGGAAVGQVVWVGTDVGWVGLAPEIDADGERVVDVVPVAREELGTWLAPYVAALLEVRDGRR